MKMKIKLKDLPGGLVAVMDDDGLLVINAKFHELLDDLLYDEEGLPKAPEVHEYYEKAMDEYYSTWRGDSQ